MLINVVLHEGHGISKGSEIYKTTFKELNLKESHIEDFLRGNIDLISEEEESLLIIGRQVMDSENGRSDLIAVDADGNLVLIEIKRDMEDILGRKEPLELQAIRYAAALAKLKTPDDVVDKIYAGYIEKNPELNPFSELTASEAARRHIDEFLRNNNATKSFNQKQRIILFASSFDVQTLSTVSWLISNNVDISCFSLTPLKIDSSIYLNITKVLPPLKLEDFYTDIKAASKRDMPIADITASKKAKTALPKMDKLFEWGVISKGDTLHIKGRGKESEATAIDEEFAEFNGNKMTYNKWGQTITGWSSIGIYDWAILDKVNRSLAELRAEKIAEKEQAEITLEQ